MRGSTASFKYVEALLKKGVNFNSKLDKNNSHLIHSVSAQTPHPKVIQLKADEGADINQRNDIGETSLNLPSVYNKNSKVI